MNHHLRRISPEFKLSSKPPLDTTSTVLKKRHSLHSVEPLRKLYRHGSHNELRRKEDCSSLGNLKLLDSKDRSASLAHLKLSDRSLSASNLAALSDTNLSLQAALPVRNYENPGSQSNIAKRSFEINVKRYFNQLTVGCGNKNCWNKFCASSTSARRLPAQMASVISIELASLGKEYFCIQDSPQDLTSLPIGEFTGEKAQAFLPKLFCSTPFKFLFVNDQLVKSKKHGYGVTKSESMGDLCGKTANIGSHNNMLNSNNLLKFSNDGKQDNCQPILLPKSKDSLLNRREKVPHNINLPSLELNIESITGEGDGLEEFEEECILEMSSGNIKEFSLTHLTLPMLERSVQNYRDCNDASFLINTIRTVFTSPEALNASFQRPSISGKENTSLDVCSVRKAYELLLTIEAKSVFHQPLKNSAEIHLKTLESVKLQASQVRQLVILLENPLVLDKLYLLQNFCAIVAKLVADTKLALVKELLNYDSRSFKNILEAIQKLLASQIHANQCSEHHIIEICMMLEVLYQVNIEAEKKGDQLVTLTEFYNEELSKKLDYKKEYEKWITGEENLVNNASEFSAVSVLNYPFVLDPSSKVRIMHIHAVWQMGTEYRDAILYQARVQQVKRAYEVADNFHIGDTVKNAMSPFLVLDVRRDCMIEDTLVQVQLKENDLKKALKIRYIGEQGLDLGGLQKEFFHIIINDIIQPDYGMFTYLNQVERMWINSSSLESDVMFELIGTLLGIAIYNGIILDLHFPPVIYKKIQGHEVNLDDLKHLDPLLAQSLQSLLHFDGDVEETFCYKFQVSHQVFGEPCNVVLKENGENITVTNENMEEFVTLYVDYLLNKSIQRQFNAFNRGFHKVCDDTCLKLFQTEELEMLICGSPNIDFSLIEESTTYENGFTCASPTILAFWDIVHCMNMEEKKSLLSFVTGSDRVPLKGLSTVAFQIIKQGEDTMKLPTALTCFNQLMLPAYGSKEKLHERLLLAIQNSKGFGLT